MVAGGGASVIYADTVAGGWASSPHLTWGVLDVIWGDAIAICGMWHLGMPASSTQPRSGEVPTLVLEQAATAAAADMRAAATQPNLRRHPNRLRITPAFFLKNMFLLSCADLGAAEELGNYAEYSGGPSAAETYQ